MTATTSALTIVKNTATAVGAWFSWEILIMIVYQCPHCENELRIDEKYAGQKGTCKHCRSAIVVPGRTTIHIAEDSAPPKLRKLFWVLAVLFPPAAIVWAYTLPKTHRQRKIGLIAPSIWLVFALIANLFSEQDDLEKGQRVARVSQSNRPPADSLSQSGVRLEKSPEEQSKTSRQPTSLTNLQNGRGGEGNRSEPRLRTTNPISTEPRGLEKPADVPRNVLAAIRQEIASRYPTNYSMQKILIDAEVQAYFALQNYSAPNVPQAVLAGVYREIANRYPTNYSMQKTLIDAQVKDYLALQSRQQPHLPNRASANSPSMRYQGTAATQPTGSTPQQILNGIRAKAQQEWPGDYEMQEYTIKNQSKSYHRLR